MLFLIYVDCFLCCAEYLQFNAVLFSSNFASISMFMSQTFSKLIALDCELHKFICLIFAPCLGDTGWLELTRVEYFLSPL